MSIPKTFQFHYTLTSSATEWYNNHVVSEHCTCQYGLPDATSLVKYSTFPKIDIQIYKEIDIKRKKYIYYYISEDEFLEIGYNDAI